MSIYEQFVTILKNDMKTMVDGIAGSIVNSKLDHSEYVNCQGRISAFGMVHTIIDRVQAYLNENPDGELSPSFIVPVDPNAAPAPVASTTSIDIDSGHVSHSEASLPDPVHVVAVDVSTGDVTQGSY